MFLSKKVKSPKMRSFAASLLILAVITAAIYCDTNVAAQADAKKAATKSNIEVTGPGALYIARKGTSIGFWVLSDSILRIIGEVSPEKQPTVVVNLSKGVTAVFYADNLPLSSNFRMQFTGTLENKKCPECTVMLPLPSKPLTQWLVNLKNETSVGNEANLQTLLKQQTEIFNAAKTVREGFLLQKKEFINTQQESLKELYDQVNAAAKDGEDKLGKALKNAQAYEKRLTPQASADSTLAQQTAATYEKFLIAQNPKINAAINCANADKIFATAGNFETYLKFEEYPDAMADDIDERLDPNWETTFAVFEHEFNGLQSRIEPCATQLMGDLLTDTDDVNFRGASPNLSQGNLIAPAPYETLGDQVSTYVANTERDIAMWQQTLERNAFKLDKLDYYLRLRRNSEALPNPLLKFLNPQSVNDDLPIDTNVVSKTIQPKDTVSSNLKKSSVQSSVSKLPVSFNLCGNDPVLTIDLRGASIIFGDDNANSITADDKINIIYGFGGDDCIDAKGDNDFVYGMDGSDTIYGGDDHDFLFGGNGADTIYGGKGKSYSVVIDGIKFTFDIGNFISGDAEGDILNGSGDNGLLNKFGFTDVIIGDGFASNGGIDKVDGDAGIDFIFGQAKNDVLGNTGYGTVKINGIPNILGSAFFGNLGDDTINGTDTPFLGSSLGDFIFGNDGVDTVNAGKGKDFVFGGKGNDLLNGNNDVDFLFGSDGVDTIHGNDGPEIIAGNEGGDTIYSDTGIGALLFGNANNDVINGGGGIDLAFGGLDKDVVNGGDGIVDLLFGNQDDDQINGQNGVDLIFGNTDKDKITGGNGVDLIFGGDGTDDVSGDDGIDIIFGNANGGQIIILNAYGQGVCTELERLNGNDGIDIIFGNAGCDELNGGGGIDIMLGGGAVDLLNGGAGMDFMWGNEHNDRINGGAGMDVGFGNAGADELNGGDATDLLFGNGSNDILKGENGFDILLGNGENDKLFGGDGVDFLFGGTGADSLNGENMSDLLFGGSENDIANGGDGADLIFGNGGEDDLSGGAATDIIFGNGNADSIYGNEGNDILFGNEGDEKMMDGQADNDLVFGNMGADNIRMTGGGNNLIFGNSDNDTIVAWEGRNLIFGNSGNDNLDGAGPCANESPREFLFGNGGSNTLRGNKKNNRDLLFGGTKNRC